MEKTAARSDLVNLRRHKLSCFHRESTPRSGLSGFNLAIDLFKIVSGCVISVIRSVMPETAIDRYSLMDFTGMYAQGTMT